MSKTNKKLTYHVGDDYAVVMTENQTTENPLARIHSDDAEDWCRLFAASPELLSACESGLRAIERFPELHKCVGDFRTEDDLREAIELARGKKWISQRPD